MKIETFTCNPFQTNTYVCHAGGEAVLVDASPATETEQQAVLAYLADNGLTVRHLLLTHGHIDHIFGCAFFAEHFGLPWQMHRADAPFLTRAAEQARFFGVPLDPPPQADHFLEAGDSITFGGGTWAVRHTPGHSPGSICFVDAENQIVLAGDVLFRGSIGRTEGLPQTSLPQLMRSIHEELLPLGDDVVVYPGHGPATTIGRERRENPFLTGAFPLV